MEKALIANNLVKRYPKAKFNAVDGIDLEVEDGQIYGFLGPNGAGKSTAIGMFVTSLFPSSGSVQIYGMDTMIHSKDIRKLIGVCYQKTSLDEKLTVEENLRSHAILYEISGFAHRFKAASPEYQKRVNELLEVVGLKNRLFDVVKTFSGGMKRKIDIVKSLLHTPKILFLDEPTTGLDPQSRRDIWDYLLDLQKKEKFTIFLTTHYLEEAEVCNQISIIDKGKILVTDTPKNLKKTTGEEILYVNPVNDDELEKELANKKISYSKDVTGSYVLDIKESPQRVLVKIKSKLEEINIKKPTLDDVFIKYTGRTITYENQN